MPELSTRDKEVAAAAWRCIPANDFPKVDFEALVNLTDIKTVKTASNIWGSIKKKIMEAEDPTKVELTERDLYIARVAWLCVDAGNIPKINTALMVEMGLFKTAKTASNTWWKVKKWLQAEAGGNNTAAGPSTPGQTAMPKTDKRKATASAPGTSDASPSKKPRKAGKSEAPKQLKEEAAEAVKQEPAKAVKQEPAEAAEEAIPLSKKPSKARKSKASKQVKEEAAEIVKEEVAEEAAPSPKKPRKARKSKTPAQVKEEASDTAEESPAEDPQAPGAFPAYV